MRIPLIVTISLFSLAACGGGSGGTTPADSMTPTDGLSNFPAIPNSGVGVDGLSFAQVSDVSTFATDANDNLDLNLNPRATVTGSASYYGTISIIVGDDLRNDPTNNQAVLGVASFDVNIADGTVGGDAGSFHNVIGNAAVPGNLSLDNGTVFEGSNLGVAGNFTGELTFADGARDLSVPANGVFVGPDGGGLVGGAPGGVAARDGAADQEATSAYVVIRD